jgi:hypothetical protein
MDNTSQVKFVSSSSVVLDFNSESNQLAEAKAIQKRMGAKMDKMIIYYLMMQSVPSCHEEMES